MVLSNRLLYFGRVSRDITVRDVLGKRLGWSESKSYLVRNAWGRTRSVDSPKGSYSVTSGYMLAGASTVGEFGTQHILSSAERGLLQGYAEPPIWPASVPEYARKTMVAQVVPPPFAAQISKAVFGYQVSALEKAKLQARLSKLEAMEDSAVNWRSETTLHSAWIADAEPSFKVAAHVRSPGEDGAIKLGKHGRWKSLGEFGWCKASIPDGEHVGLIKQQPWLFCKNPPLLEESFSAFHSRGRREKLDLIQKLLEQAAMEVEDKALGCQAISVAAKLSHHFVNIHPYPDGLFQREPNENQTELDPEWFGPYLARGEKYKTPRTPENVRKAAEEIGLYDLDDDDQSEQQFYIDLIRELWVLFDNKLQAVAGVEIDLDLSDVHVDCCRSHC